MLFRPKSVKKLDTFLKKEEKIPTSRTTRGDTNP